MATNGKKKLSRDEEIVRTAQVKAWITALLNEHRDHTFTVAEILGALKEQLDSVSYNGPANLRSLLKTMALNELIAEAREGGKVLYASTNAPRPATQSSPETKAKNGKSNVPPNIKIDVVKATGKVRLTIAGLLLEIGVVDQ